MSDFNFDEFDSLLADIEKTIATIDTPATKPEPVVAPRIPLTKRVSRLPDTMKLDLFHSHQEGPPTPGTPISREQFYLFLQDAAPNFTWPDDRRVLHGPTYIRAFNQQGHTFDPITALALFRLGKHYNVCLWDYAAIELGLSTEDANAISQASACDVSPSAMEIRRMLCAAISQRLQIKF